MGFDYLSGTPASNLIQTFVEPNTKEEEYNLFRKYHRTGSDDDLWNIVHTYTPIIRKAVNNFSGYRVNAEDLASEGLVALTEAAKRFDITLGFRFATFAKRWVRGFMFVFITRNIFPVSISKEREAKQLFFKLKRYIVESSASEEDLKLTSVLAETLAKKHGIPVYEIERMYSLLTSPSDYMGDPIEPSNEGRTFTVEDTLAASSDTYEATQKMETYEFQKRIIRDAMAEVLDEREAAIYYAQVICDRNDDGFKTLDALADDYKVSKERIRQLRIEAARRMEEKIEEKIRKEGWGPDDLFS